MAEIDLGTVTIEKAHTMTGTVNAVPGEAGGGITLPTLSNPAAAADIRKNMETISQSGKKITGSMPEKAAQTFDPSLSEQTINAGQYLKGAQTINPVTGALLAQLDPDFTAANIRKGAELFGVSGSYEAQATAPVIRSLEITENGTYTAPEGVDGYSPITVSVAASGGGGGSTIYTGSFTPAENLSQVVISIPIEPKNFIYWKNTKTFNYGVRTAYGMWFIENAPVVMAGSNTAGTSLGTVAITESYEAYIEETKQNVKPLHYIFYADGVLTIAVRTGSAGAGYLVPEQYNWIAW